MLHDDKPPLNNATLEHFGILGMRWGIRKHYTGGQIRVARESAARTKKAVENTKLAVNAGLAPKESIAQVKLAHLNNPDRAIAARITRGEVVAISILATPAPALALVARSQVKSRAIESRQKLDYYNRYDRFQTKQNEKRSNAGRR